MLRVTNNHNFKQHIRFLCHQVVHRRLHLRGAAQSGGLGGAHQHAAAGAARVGGPREEQDPGRAQGEL